MTTTFYLVRPAACDDIIYSPAPPRDGPFLGAEGWAQAWRLAERLRCETFVSIISSPRERTRDTASAISIASEIGPVEVSPELDEVDFETPRGRNFTELNRDAAWRHSNGHRAVAATPKGETMGHVQHRMCACMRTLSRKHAGEAVVLVSHADVIKSAICRVLGLTPDSCFRFDIDPASISVVVMGEWGAKLLRLNENV